MFEDIIKSLYIHVTAHTVYYVCCILMHCYSDFPFLMCDVKDTEISSVFCLFYSSLVAFKNNHYTSLLFYVIFIFFLLFTFIRFAYPVKKEAYIVKLIWQEAIRVCDDIINTQGNRNLVKEMLTSVC